MSYLNRILGIVVCSTLSLPVVAHAQANDTDPGEASGNPDAAGEAGPATSGESVETGEPLPTVTSDNDPQPEAAAVVPPSSGLVSQAGVGGQVAYGRHGVLELGGAAGFIAATDFQSFSFSPSVGWFLADNLQISAIINLAYAKIGEESTMTFTGLLEPSYHIPFSNTVYGFLGVGGGIGYVEGPGTGFALQPRLGANFLVGRSGVLTPALFFQYTTHEATQTPNGAVLAVSSAYGLQIGYTVMW